MKSDFPPEVVEPLCSAIGHMVLSWSQVEVCLDYSTAIIFQAAGGRHLDDQIPQALGRKIKFLRRCFRQIDTLLPFANEMLPYLDETKRLSETRHLIIHGVASKYDETSQRFRFVKLDLINGKTLHRAKESWIPVDKILNDAIDCQELAGAFISFVDRLLKALVPEYEGNELIR